MGLGIRTKNNNTSNQTQTVSTTAVTFPVVGTLAGSRRVLIGTSFPFTEAVTGIISFPTRRTGNSRLNNRHWIQHSILNIEAMTYEPRLLFRRNLKTDSWSLGIQIRYLF